VTQLDPFESKDSNLPSEPKRSSFIYAKLVRSDTDLIGLIAYSLYKRNKIAFFNHCFEQTGDGPERDQLHGFHQSCSLPDQLAAFRAEATKALENFGTAIIEGEIEQMDAEYQRKLILELKRAQPFWRAVGQNIVASFAVLAITALVLAVLWSTTIGPKEVVEKIFNVDIRAKPAVP